MMGKKKAEEKDGRGEREGERGKGTTRIFHLLKYVDVYGGNAC